MSSKLLSFLGVAAVSALLGAGPALAAPVNTDADAVRAREVKRHLDAAQSAKPFKADKVRAGHVKMTGNGIRQTPDTPITADKARQEMLRPGPYDGPMFDKPDQRPGVRPISQDKDNQGQAAEPRWNDTRPEKSMPPRRHYQPAVRDQGMPPVAPARSSDDSGRQIRSQRDRAPISPEQWKQTRGDELPFSYHR